MEFSPREHAILFACLARGLREASPDLAGASLTSAVRAYGNQRGRRMALRAERDGCNLDVRGYLLYGEWRDQTGVSDMQVSQFEPEVCLSCQHCPWHSAWVELGMEEYATYYCRYVDMALADGFNGLDLVVDESLSLEGSQCRFRFANSGISPDRQRGLAEYRTRLGDRATKPWLYHLGHLYAAISKTSAATLGEQGRRGLAQGMDYFAELCGEEARQAVLEAAKQDFTSISDYPGL